MPAMVTMKPRESNMITPMRCLNGMLRRIMRGIGNVVTSKSEMQFNTPAASVAVPSGKHLASGIGGNTQYA